MPDFFIGWKSDAIVIGLYQLSNIEIPFFPKFHPYLPVYNGTMSLAVVYGFF